MLFALQIDPYECSLRHVGTHLLMRDLTQEDVWDALGKGRAYVAFDWLCDATGFDFAAEADGKRFEMGSQVSLAEALLSAARLRTPDTGNCSARAKSSRKQTATR